MRHCRKHGKPITLEVWTFEDQVECTKFALQFSKDNNIVESPEWANMIVEDGINTPPSAKGKKQSPEHVSRQCAARRGLKRSDEFRRYLSSIKTGSKTGPCTEEHKRNIAATKLGRLWYTNPGRTEQKLCHLNSQPDGWIRGIKKR